MTESIAVTPNNAAQIKAVAANAPPAAPLGIKVNNAVGKTASITFKNGAVASSETTTIQTATAKADTSVNSDRAGQPVQGRSGFGRPLTSSELKDSSEIDVGNGITTSLAAAKTSGLVTQNEHGQWVYAGATKGFNAPQQPARATEAKPNEQQQQPQTKPDDAPAAEPVEALDDVSEAVMTDVVSKLPGTEAKSFASELIDNGSLSPQAMQQAAARLGITPEEVAAKAEGVRAAFHAQAAKAIGPLAENVFTWARNHASKELRAAIESHVNDGSTKAYMAIANKFVLTLPEHSPNLILKSADAAARGIRREADGSITINDAKHGRVEWKNAIRIGLIKPFLPK